MKSDDEDSSESDTELKDDMEALKQAFLLTGTNPSDLQLVSAGNNADNDDFHGGFSPGESSSDDDVEDDFQLVRDIQKRFDLLKETEGEGEPLLRQPLYSFPPVSSDSEDDLETLRAIQHRFAAYGDGRTQGSIEKVVSKSEQVGVTNIDSEKETSSNCFVESSNAWEGFPDCVDKSSSSTQSLEACNTTVAGSWPSEVIDRHHADADIGPVKGSRLPESAQAFWDAIKKNRSCQKLIRSNLLHIEARIEEIKILKDRVKILKDYQVACKVRTGRALSQKKDARVQLISAMKPRTHSKVNGKSSAMHYGPAENSQAATCRETLDKFPVFIKREKWSDKEKKNLAKGVRQQLQEMLLQRSFDLASTADVSCEEYVNVDSIVSSISDLDITPENIRAFLPMVNWDHLASMYVSSRSGAECQARWLNFEDPLINHSPWSTEEDKNLLRVVQHKGLSNWIDIAVSLGTNRTPFQCLARYQRSLNASLIKREWTKEEDNQLRAAVEAFGESDWQAVASSMEGRTGTQCSNRWIKTLHPARQKVGKWTHEEDERLKVAVMLFGPKTWRKVADSIPGRTHVQCRERWVNSLDPSLNLKEWTKEEDMRLKEAILEHGYCWSKVATCVPARTDNHCWRRWKALFPHDVPLLQAARSIQRAALVSNFVDRESERSLLGPGDFAPPSKMDRMSQLEWIDESATADTPKSDLCNEEAPRVTNGTRNKRRKMPLRKKQNKKDPMYVYDEKEFKLLDEEEPESEFPCSSLSDVSLPNGEVGRNDEDAKSHKRSSKLQPRRRKCLDTQEKGVVENGEVGRNNEDAKSQKRPSKLQPRRRKCLLDRKENEVVENGEFLSSFDDDPSFLMASMGKSADDLDLFRNGEVEEISVPNQVGTDVGNKIARNKSEAIIGYTRRVKNIRLQQNNSCSSPKSMITSECIPPPASVVESKLAKSGKRHRSCLSPIRSLSASGIVENGSSKASSDSPEFKRSRRIQARDYLNKMMEEDDDISLASYLQHIKRLKRQKGTTSKG